VSFVEIFFSYIHCNQEMGVGNHGGWGLELGSCDNDRFEFGIKREMEGLEV
jgi:hypothetical protein